MNNKYLKSDCRSLELHSVIADKIKNNPLLLNTAFENISRWKEQNDFPQPYLDDWLNIINNGLPSLLNFLVSETDEAQRLRSSSVFSGILTDEERNEIFEKYK